MIHPSYTELIDVLSGQESLDNSMLSRYTIIIASAKRARQLVDGSEPDVYKRQDFKKGCCLCARNKNFESGKI